MEAMIVFRDWFHQPTMESEPQLGQQLSDLWARLAKRYSAFTSYEFLPLGFIDAPVEELQKVNGEGGVRAVLEPSSGWRNHRSEYAKVLRALNALRSETGSQVFQWYNHVANGGTLPHEAYQGGWWPPRAGYPRLRDGRSDGLDADVSLVMGAPPAWMPIINLSFEFRLEYEVNDPVAVALAAAAATHLVVVAVGNAGASAGSLNPWAVDDSVLSVGATEDEAGSRLADYSSRGRSDTHSTGPDVVAWGQSPFGAKGTSYATPRVAMLGVFCAALIAQIHHAWLLAREVRNIGVPLMGWGLVDAFDASSESEDLPGRLDAPALPIIGVRWDAMVQALREVDLRVEHRSPLLKRIILNAAQPMPQYREHEVGAGFIRTDLLVEHFGKLTVGDVVRWFSPGARVRASVAREPAFVVDELQALVSVVRRTAPTWFWDLGRESFVVNGRVVDNRRSDHAAIVERARRSGHGFRVVGTGLEPRSESNHLGSEWPS